jgi:phosphoserine aminotransferase
MPKPSVKPNNPNFSSGPCAKRPGWSIEALKDATVARSHRAKVAKTKLGGVIERSKSLLEIPKDYRLGIVPASDTGAIEMALWSLLGERGVDVLAWEAFGASWANDCEKQQRSSRVEDGLR